MVIAGDVVLTLLALFTVRVRNRRIPCSTWAKLNKKGIIVDFRFIRYLSGSLEGAISRPVSETGPPGDAWFK
jgi:hypothetical protein